MSPQFAFYLSWFLFFASWAGAAFWADQAAARPGFWNEAPYRLISVFGFVLLFGVYDLPFLPISPLWRMDRGWQWFVLLFALAGFGFCWWARVHLGKLWSGWITTKADHHVVDTGPYAIVRHPIYTGFILAAAATAITKGTATALVGAFIIAGGYWLKARLEEQFLAKQLGAEAYAAYRSKVPMLVPFWPSFT